MDDDTAVRMVFEFSLAMERFIPRVTGGFAPETDWIGLVVRRRDRYRALANIPIRNKMKEWVSGRAQRSRLTRRLEKPLSGAALVETIGAASSNAT